MLKDPFIIEKILTDEYSHLAKWYRVEDFHSDDTGIGVSLTISSLDEKDFGRMNVRLTWDINYKDTEYIRTSYNSPLQHYATMGTTEYIHPLYPDKSLLIVVSGLNGVAFTFYENLKRYLRESKIDTLLSI